MKISERDILSVTLNIDSENSQINISNNEEEEVIDLNDLKTYNNELEEDTNILVKNITFEKFDTKIERSLTICQGFYQFISLTYLMDFFENLNTGRRFLKNMSDINDINISDSQLYRKNWRNILLPELITN